MPAPHDHHPHDHSIEEQRAALTAAFWDERYAGSDRVWSGRPNQRLVEQTADLAPGRALDVACGEGADAVWLAGQGWDVTAVDVSAVALGRVRRHAEERGVADRVTTREWDALGADRPAADLPAYDLVTASFLHVPPEDFGGVYGRIAEAVAPGGRLLVTAHHPDDVASGARRPHGPGLLFEPEAVLGTLGVGSGSEWEAEVVDTPLREQAGPDGPVQVRDTVVRLRRR